MSVEITAILKNATIVGAGRGRKIAMGDIYNDVNKRWPDGTSIRTSLIINGPSEDGIIETLNSVYRLEYNK